MLRFAPDGATAAFCSAAVLGGIGTSSTTQTQEHPIQLHSPGASDLRSLDGRDVTITWLREAYYRGLVIRDETGPVYIADGGVAAAFVEDQLGGNPASPGQTIANTKESGRDVRYTTLEFASDEGPIELVPGEVATLTIDGTMCRAAAVAAWNSSSTGPTPRCISMVSAFSYELLRIDAAVEPDRLARAPGMGIARYGCAWDDS